MNRIRQQYLLLLLARCVEHTRNALLGLALDYLAYRIGRPWVVGAATLIVRNGRAVFPVAYALERFCLYYLAGVTPDQLDSCFVFSIALLLVHVAHPLVFTQEVNLPLAEVWHDFRQTGVPTLPVFVYVVGLVHYPRWTAGVTREVVGRRVPAWLWEHFTLRDVFGGGWNVFLVVAGAMLMFERVLVPLGRLVFAVVEWGWRRVGREYYNVRVWFRHWFTGGESPGGYRRPQRLGLNQTLPPFTYSELGDDQMRVLHLLPRGNSDIIRCEIEHIPLNKPLVYEAISYTWGPVHLCKTIYVNDHRFRVTQQVYDLLLDRSPVFSPRTIWIDAICINQKDNEEKGHQVTLMHHIFSRASRVTVWLGGAPDAHLAVDLLLELAHLFKNYPMTDADLWARYVGERRSPRWLALGDMMEHPYFTRIWVLQEISANRTVHVVYGGQLLNWDTLTLVLLTLFMANRLSMFVEDAAEPGKKRGGLLNSSNIVFLNKVRGATQKGERPVLADMLTSCWTLQATDRRDKIFGLWALAADGDDDLVRPDYTKTETEVFTDAAVYLALRGEGEDLLSVLGCAGIGWPRSVPDLPSWAPDWSTVGRSLIGSFPKNSRNHYRPFGDLTASPLRIFAGETSTTRMIELDAILFPHDPIQHLTPEFQRPMKLSPTGGYTVDLSAMAGRTGPWLISALTLLGTYLGRDLANTLYPPTSQPLEEALWRTLIVDSALYTPNGATRTADARPAPAAYGAYFREYLRYHMTTAMEGAEVLGNPTLAAQLASFFAHQEGDAQFFDDANDDMDRARKCGLWVTSAQSRFMSRRLAITGRKGLVALVPPGTEQGDVIVVIPGVPTPMVVRLVSTWADGDVEKHAVLLVGECYVHGLMDGGEWVRQDAVERIVIL